MKVTNTQWKLVLACAMLGLTALGHGQMALQTLRSFGVPGHSAASPRAPLVQGPDGALYGTTTFGILSSTTRGLGTSGFGTVFKINPDGTGFSILHYFALDSTNGCWPKDGLLAGSDGILYGTTEGDPSGETIGTVFRLNPDGTGFETLYTFDYPERGPCAGLIQGQDGTLYGLTAGGDGVLFKLNRDGTGFTVVHTFSAEDYPCGLLAQDPTGVLYGATQGGIVFKVNTDGTGFAVVLDLSATQAGSVAAGLVLGADGALYGASPHGGAGNAGTVFKLRPDGTGFSVLHSFSSSGSDGRSPAAALVSGKDGALYGATPYGGQGNCGTVFRITPDGSSFSTLYSFSSSGGDAQAPAAALAQGRDGALYGTTSTGGSGDGTVFKINPDGSGYSVLWRLSLSGGDVISPGPCLILGSDDVIYGTAQASSDGAGSVFRINRDGTGYAVLCLIRTSPNGWNVPQALIQGADGALYGVTSYGGDADLGSVFKVNRDGTGFVFLHSFTNSASKSQVIPNSLVQGPGGVLYGTTWYGGEENSGTVFRLNLDGSGFETLCSFGAGAPRYPQTGLLSGYEGVLYGRTSDEAGADQASVFSINPDGSGFAIAHTFVNAPGQVQNPNTPMVVDANGTLYGTAWVDEDVSVIGVFALKRDGTCAVLHCFLGQGDGQSPQAGVVQAVDGMLHGTTTQGGATPADPSGNGTVFQISTDGSGYATRYLFHSENPNTPLVQDRDGVFYGATEYGGLMGLGTLFRLADDLPNILTEPGSQLGQLATNVSLAVRAWSSLSLSYQWRFNGASLPGATNSSLLLTHVQPAQTGNYDVIITDARGSVTSAMATLVLTGPPPCSCSGMNPQTIWSFSPADALGTAPQSGLLRGRDGAWYGSTANSVFRIAADGTGPVVLYRFDSGEGSGARLAQGSDGALYGGLTCGLFRLSLDGSSYAIVSSGLWGDSVVEGATGVWFGLGSGGGSPDPGAVWSVHADGTGLSVLHPFANQGDGREPAAPLARGPDGALYGTTRYGGANSGKWGADSGSIFRVSLDGATYSVLHNFGQTTNDGQYPYAGVVRGLDGAFYGTTYGGGSSNLGTIFKISATGTDYSVLWNFGTNSGDGVQPQAELLAGNDGTLYGTACNGGSAGFGTVFRINPDGTGYSTLHDFTGVGEDGRNPIAGLAQGPDGALWGTTPAGGLNDLGTVFHLTCLPLILSQPVSRTVPLGTDVALVAECGSLMTWGAQWLLNGRPMPGATGTLLTLAKVGTADAGNYQLVVTNSCGSVTSAIAALSVVAGQPTPVTACTEAALRQAMSRGGRVTFACDGTISLAAPITNLTDTVIDATGHNIIIRGTNVTGLFYVSKVSLTLINLTVADGQAQSGAGVFNDGGILTLENVSFKNNTVLPNAQPVLAQPGQGGAVYTRDGALYATNCVFLNNQVGSAAGGVFGGGAICIESGQAILQGCLFSSNSARGDVLYNQGYPAGGGAIHNAGTLRLEGCSFIGNTAIGGGQGQFCPSGGAIYNLGDLDLAQSTFASNFVAGASGVGGYEGMAGNGGEGGPGAGAAGGALFNASTASLVNNTFAGNSALGGSGGYGGQGYCSSGGDGGPGGGAWGGALCDTNGALTSVTNCSFACNSATGGLGGPGGPGGDPWNPGDWNPNWHAGSRGPDGWDFGGALFTGAGTVVNTLLAANSPSNQFIDGGHNLDLASCDGVVGPLADNGGSTLTMALPPGSPAIDAADDAWAPPNDQRGVPRLYGSGCDIGSFEVKTGVVLQATLGPAGAIELRLGGGAGQTYRLLSSSNLVEWVAIATNQIGAGLVSGIELSSGSQREFYQARLLLPGAGSYAIHGQASPSSGGWVAGGGQFLSGYQASLAASPEPGYAFVNWVENGVLLSTSRVYTVTASADRTLTAVFCPLYSVTLNASPPNGGLVSGGATVVSGASLTVMATAATGYAFANWAENGTVLSTSANYTFTVTANHSLTANFVPLYTLVANVSPEGGGSVAGGGTFPSGASVTLAASPNPTYVFADWTQNGVVVSTSPSFNFTLTNNCVLTANFAPSCTVTLSDSQADQGTVAGGGTFLNGSSVSVLATPDAGFAFADWTENGVVVSRSASYSFEVTNSRALTANFAPARTVAVSATPVAGGFVSGGGIYPSGASVTVSAMTNSGYVFIDWTDNGLPVSYSPTLTFEVTNSLALTANFGSPCTVSLIAAPAPDGAVSGAGTFLYGSNVTVVATANSGFAFANWTESGLPVSGSASYTFTATTNRVLTANFGPACAVTLSASPPESGSVAGSGSYAQGSIATIMAAPTSGYALVNWMENGAPVTVLPSYTFTVKSNRTFTATFEASQTVQVLSQCTEDALRSAMAQGGTVAFARGGVITLTNAIVVTNDTVLDGTANPITITGQNGALVVNSKVTLKVRNLTFANSTQPNVFLIQPGGAILNDGGVLILNGVSFLTNATVQFGGALGNRNQGLVNATNCTFAGNYCGWEWGDGNGSQQLGWIRANLPAAGGAIFNQDGQVNLEACQFQGNRAQGGSDNPILGPGTGGVGGAAGSGGAIQNAGRLTVSRCTFQDNSAGGGYGFTWLLEYGPYYGASGTPGGEGSGGAICNAGALFLRDSTVAGGQVVGGDGGRGQIGSVNSSTGQGTGSGNGGNGGSAYGGGLFNSGTGVVVNCTFYGNLGAGGDGGVGGPAFTNSYFFEGRTVVEAWPAGVDGADGSAGGGVWSTTAALYLTNCTLAFNGASIGPSGAQAVGGFSAPGAFAVNTLWSANEPGGNALGSFIDGGHNLSSDASCALSRPTSLANTDPMLGPLADHGGPTLTLALLPGSPAIDAGDTLAAPPTDQRGFPRPYGPAADIGAYEAMPLYTLSVSGSPPEGGAVSGGGIFGANSAVTALAAANPGYAFVEWTENGTVVSASARYAFTLTTNRVLTASFVDTKP